MKKIIIIAALFVLGSCSKEESKPQPVVYPIVFTEDATPNNWEFKPQTNFLTVKANFRPAKLIDTTKQDKYVIEISTNNDFTDIKTSQTFYTNLNSVDIVRGYGIIQQSQFTFKTTAYFRAKRVADNISSEVRMVRFNWK